MDALTSLNVFRQIAESGSFVAAARERGEDPVGRDSCVRAACSHRMQSLDGQRGPPREVPVLSYSPLVITAMDAHPGRNGAVPLYSFHPQLGVMFVAQHYLVPNATAATQLFISAGYIYTPLTMGFRRFS
jgi:hypothetical protein